MILSAPTWPTPDQIGAVSTTRAGGTSPAPFDSLNLGFHVGDDPENVEKNRRRLTTEAGDVDFCWLSQVHGTRVVRAEDVQAGDEPIEADASVSTTPGLACVVMTADCLPVIFFDRGATTVACAHAGWRGLAAGVLENTVAATDCAPGDLLVWLGPAIGADVFEVGPDVRTAFLNADEGCAQCFAPSPFNPDTRWVADLYELARRRLQAQGVDADAIYGGDFCTYTDDERFFSYRRDGQTGRQATAIWIR